MASTDLHVGVVMPVFEIHLVKVWVGVGPGTVGVVMFNVIMLMAGMRMGVGHLAVVVLVLVVMGCGVLVGFGHLVAPSLAGSVVADLDADCSARCRWSFTDRWSICRRASSSNAATWESKSP